MGHPSAQPPPALLSMLAGQKTNDLSGNEEGELGQRQLQHTEKEEGINQVWMVTLGLIVVVEKTATVSVCNHSNQSQKPLERPLQLGIELVSAYS